MKLKTIISLVFTILSMQIFSQSFTFIRTSPPFVEATCTEWEIVSWGTINNTTQSNIRLFFQRTQNNLPNGWESAFCINLCYPPTVDTATETVTPGAHDFSLHFYPDSIPGTGIVQMKAKNVNNPSDTISVTFGATGSPVSVKQISSVIKDFSLNQNYPNPFNPNTKISFSIPRSDFVTLRIYDILGREIQVLLNQHLQPGEFEYEFNANGLSSGMYYYSLRSGDFVSVRKMVLVK